MYCNLSLSYYDKLIATIHKENIASMYKDIDDETEQLYRFYEMRRDS